MRGEWSKFCRVTLTHGLSPNAKHRHRDLQLLNAGAHLLKVLGKVWAEGVRERDHKVIKSLVDPRCVRLLCVEDFGYNTRTRCGEHSYRRLAEDQVATIRSDQILIKCFACLRSAQRTLRRS